MYTPILKSRVLNVSIDNENVNSEKQHEKFPFMVHMDIKISKNQFFDQILWLVIEPLNVSVRENMNNSLVRTENGGLEMQIQYYLMRYPIRARDKIRIFKTFSC